MGQDHYLVGAAPMPRPALLCVALVFVGCSSGDPSNDLLTPGQVVVVSAKDGATLDHADIRVIYPRLQPGVTARVGSDPGYHITDEFKHDRDSEVSEADQKRAFDDAPHERYMPPNPLAAYRRIKVTVETGQHAGASGEVYRNDVRPIP